MINLDLMLPLSALNDLPRYHYLTTFIFLALYKMSLPVGFCMGQALLWQALLNSIELFSVLSLRRRPVSPTSHGIGTSLGGSVLQRI